VPELLVLVPREIHVPEIAAVRLLFPRAVTESSSATSDVPLRRAGAELLVAGPVRFLIETNQRHRSGDGRVRVAAMLLRRVPRRVGSRRLDLRSGRLEQSDQRHRAAPPQRRARLRPTARPCDVEGSVKCHSTSRVSFARLPRRATSLESNFASPMPHVPMTVSATPTHSRRFANWRKPPRARRRYVSCSALPTTGSVEQHPVLADCERALGNHSAVTELFGELRQAGAGSDVLAEGRLVMAGSLADRGRVDEAIELLLPAVNRPVRKPLDRHLRQWYAIADLYERSGDLPRAREYFVKVVSDVVERLASLR
jgi:hypothetical protein